MAIPVTLGIDIGGTNSKLGLVDSEGNCLESSTMPTHANEDISVFIGHLMEEISKIREAIEQEVEVLGVGIGAPNANYYSGQIEKAPNLHWGDAIPLAAIVKERLQLPVWITNDANAAAIGEMKFGAAKGVKDFVVVTLGTGLGSGIVMDGDLVYGHDGFAGELGHTTVDPNGRDHTTNRKGSLETYVSATGIVRTAFDLMANRIHASRMRKLNFEQLTSKIVTEEALKGDRIALETCEMTGKYLGTALVNTILLCNPERIILFGGPTAAGDLLLIPTLKYLNQGLPIHRRNKTSVVISSMKGSNTAVLGASALAWDEMEKVKV
ncbi:MAG: glucokinase [Flammeovirgaceae bacterium]|jgi:glucokinase